MIKYFTTVTNERGDVLPNYRMQVVDSGGSVVTIYADKGGTRFTDASGNIINYATAAANGRVSFYWIPAEGQTLQTLDAGGNLVDAEADFADDRVLDVLPGEIAQSAVTNLTTDLAAKAAVADLASTVAGEGAALVGRETGGTIAQAMSGRVHGKEFGCVADGVTDDSAALQAMADYALANNIRDVFLPGGNIALANSVCWPYGVRVHGARSTGNATRPATRIVPIAGGTFIGGYVFLFNSRDAATSEQVGNYHGGGAQDILFDNGTSPIAGVRAIVAAGHNYTFKNIGANDMLQSIVRAPWEYSDNFRLEQCFHAKSYDNSVYQIEIAGEGDCCVIDGYNARNVEHASIWLRGDPPSTNYVNECFIKSVINGNIRNDGFNVVIENWHNESGYLVYTQGSSTVIRNSQLYQTDQFTHPVVRYQALGTISTDLPVRLTLDNVSFINFGRSQHGAGYSGISVYTDGLFEVSMPQQGLLTLRDVRRRVNGAENAPLVETAIRVCQSDETTPVANFADYAEHLCRDGHVKAQYLIDYAGMNCAGYNGDLIRFGAGTAVNTGNAGAWSIATGTYRYQVVRLFDPVAAIGANVGAEVSVNIASDTNVASLTTFGASQALRGVYRIYRASPGTPAGQYDAVANVTAMAGVTPYFTDEGDKVAGVPWTSRTAAAIDSYTILESNVPFNIEGAGKLRTTRPVYKLAGDAAVNLTKFANEYVVVFNVPLTANRNVARPGTKDNVRFKVVRTAAATGAFNVTVSGLVGTAPTLPAPAGASNFFEAGYDAFLGGWLVLGGGSL